MAENVTFKVGDVLNIDKQENVPVVELICSMCVAEGRPEPVALPTTRIWIPALLKRWIPKWEREKYMSLEEAVAKAPAFKALVRQDRRGRDEVREQCPEHGKQLRAARIWTDQLFQVERRKAEAKAKREAEEQETAETTFGSIAAILGGERVEELKDAIGKAETRRAKSAAKKADGRKAGQPEGKGRKPRASSKGRSKAKLQEQIEEALDGDEPTGE